LSLNSIGKIGKDHESKPIAYNKSNIEKEVEPKILPDT